MLSKRLIGPLFVIAIVVGILSGESAITPSSYYASPFFWIGLVGFTLIGAFVYGSVKSNRLPRYGALAVLFAMFGLALLSSQYSDLLPFGFGIVGLFVGLGARALYAMLYLSRWTYCPQCGRTGWAVRRGDKWFCEKQGHEITPVPVKT